MADRSADGDVRADRTSNGVHIRRMLLIWIAEMIVVEPIIYFVIGPHIPPGSMTSAAHGAQFDAYVITMVANGPMAAVLIYFIYAIVVWRKPKGEPLVTGPPLRQNARASFWWIFLVTAIVIGLFTFGTYELIVPTGAGGGEGPSPIWGPNAKTTHILNVQVIGQQWMWTYRYPQYGGMESLTPVLPVGTEIAFHVTSLDVIHDWWSYQLGIKADANPGVDNVAFAFTGQKGTFVDRCDELCGIWHGAMFDHGRVVSKAAFNAWATAKERKEKSDGLLKLLPKFAWVYYPSANTAGATFYPATDPFYKAYKYEFGTSGPEGILPGVHVRGVTTNSSGAVTSNTST